MTAKPKRRWLQFSLSTLLVFVAAICVFLAVRSNRQHDRRVAIAKIEKLGGKITYLSELGEGNSFAHVGDRTICSPTIGPLARLLGDNPATCVVVLEFSEDTRVTDTDLATMRSFSELQLLIVANNSVTDDGLMSLSPLSHLLYVEFTSATNLTGAGIADFQKAMPNCDIEVVE